MNRRGGLPALVPLVIAMTFLLGAGSPFEAADQQPLEPSTREELLGWARCTWHSLAAMTGTSGLTADRIEVDGRGEWHPSKPTSPTDVAAYLWSVLAARALGLIDDPEADRRLGATLDTLGRMERNQGFYFNTYEATSGGRIGGVGAKDPATRLFLSSVDNGWLAVALTMVRNTRPALRDRADALLGPMDFGIFYVPFDPADPVKRPGQLHGGIHTDDGSATAFYGMLNTEPRIVSYLAIARGQVPAEHYYRLFRTFPVDHGPQVQEPRGEDRTYLGLPVFEGHYHYRGVDFVPTWGGSMFEALMVPLFVPEETWAPRSWGVNHPLYARLQREQGLEVMRYGFWGFSPSWKPEGGYQTYGVNRLGTEVGGYLTYEVLSGSKPKGGKEAGAAREGIVTPHASFLALRYEPDEVLANLRRLAKAFPMVDAMGFRDSVNVTTGEVAPCVLALDQGMILAAIANALADDTLRRALCDGPIERAIHPLIAPEGFTVGDRRR